LRRANLRAVASLGRFRKHTGDLIRREVDLMSYPSDAMHGILWTLDSGDTHSVLNVNTGHPAMRTARSDEVRLSVYLNCIASGIAKHLCQGGTFEEYEEQKARVLAALSIPKDAEKTKK
jgi:hypothetical protein